MILRSSASRLMAVLLLLTILPSAMAQRQPATPVPADHATMVIMAPLGPVTADLRISVAKMPYRAWVGQFLAQQMDLDRNGRLNESELGLLTDNVRRLGNISGPREILASPAGVRQAEEISGKDFAEWLRLRLPKSFDLIAQPQSSDDAVRLASLIDRDQNASISQDELLIAVQTLRFRDLDDDETFSVSELLPYRDPRSQNAPVTPNALSLPFFHVTDEESTLRAAEHIIERYGQDKLISSRLLRQTSEPETSPEAMLDRPAVQRYLGAPTFHLQIDVRLSDRAGTSGIDVTVDPSALEFCRVTDDTFGQTAVVIDGLPLKIVARGGGANNRAVTRGFLGQTFVMIDSDRNQYLDETEFAGMVGPMQQSGATGDFKTVDANADKMVTREELFSFVERDLMAASSRIEVTVKQEGKTLFGLLDRNQDRRLSSREIRGGTGVLTKFDLNGDGAFAETELGTEYVLTLGLGRSELRRASGTMQMGTMQMGSGDAILPGSAGLSGPEWFRRMDRNQDGDVSAREFLGASRHFQKIDADQDGLISVNEAEIISML